MTLPQLRNVTQTTTDMQAKDGSLPSDANNSPSIINSLQSDANAGINQIINIVKYSKYPKLLRVAAYIFRFKRKTKLINELTSAERRWLKSYQENAYPDEITSLNSKKPAILSLVKQLRLFADSNGIIRSGIRITEN